MQVDGTGPQAKRGHFSIPPMRNGYFVRQKTANRLFRAVDAMLAAFVRIWPSKPCRSITRILVTNGAHLGDAIITTSVLPALKSAFPAAEIGVLVGSWSRAVVDGHPLVDRVHVVDHWRMNRSNVSRWAKFRHYLATRRQALTELKLVRYDAAIDLYFYFPNSIALLWQAGIPKRIGYTSAGFGPLLSDPVPLVFDNRSMVDHHHALLARLPHAGAVRHLMAPSLARLHGTARWTIRQPYMVLHVGSGSADKDWTVDGWRALVARLVEAGHRLVFTGSGERERVLIKQIIGDRPEPLNLWGELDWNAFVEAVASARFLVGVDSAAGHVASAVGTPGIVIGNGLNNPFLWKPTSPRVEVTLFDMPCIPCYRKHGCATKDCIRSLSPETVGDRIDALLEIHSTQATPSAS